MWRDYIHRRLKQRDAVVVEWTAPAKLDLKDVHDYIARDSRYYAQKVSQDIVDKSEKLEYFPEIGRVVPEIENPNVREIFVYSYRPTIIVNENQTNGNENRYAVEKTAVVW